ncbi:sensor histidine kinase [Chryseolinea lacunae]|uniref:histidine kinase n=1 Tax=Chryseolinea lacunae TaxID=2801331 RepID=A0ABS1KLW7_9BACT|nr:hybrid sensor histidine kinase/response regulator [Chryseolinea lacunae]MBL0740222.1 response regulator [Chryseolinea lacunae]
MNDKPLRILVLEDVEDDVGLIERVLQKEGITFETNRVDSRQEFVDALRTYEADVILSDHRLPQFNSFDALKLCRRAGVQIPFILVTGSVSEEFAVSCLKQGADDYVLKSNLIRLPAAIVNSLKQKALEKERKRSDGELRKQNEELVKINKELDSFVYSVSHNLRAPLMSVLGLLNLAKMNDQQRDNIFDHYFNMMEHSIQKLDDTLKEILDYSRNARNNLNVKKVNLAEIVSDSVERLQYMEGSDQIIKEIKIDETIPLYADGYRLSVIFNNLLSNAIKYRDLQKDESFVRFLITVDERKATFHFHDNGIGITADLLPRVFDMFFRATDRSEGAGLGLYIVKETVEKLRGQITVQSTFGEGTMFKFEIPNMKLAEELGEDMV